ncbi:hypothetical protein BGX26_003496, partial [Mortierella sp. AD094]
FIRHRIPCKHLYLVQIHTEYEITHSPDPEPAEPAQDDVDNIDDYFEAPLEHELPVNVRLLLEDQRRQMKEQKKREQREAEEEATEACFEELKRLWVQIGHIINNGERSCNLAHMFNAVASLRSAAHDIKGIVRK